MQVAIVGGGALGLLLAASLQNEGFPVVLVTRTKEQAAFIGSRGIHLSKLDGSAITVFPHKVIPVRELNHVTTAAFTLLTVKQGGVVDTAEYMKKWGGGGVIVCWQNGMGHMQVLRNNMKDVPLYVAITTEGANRTGPNEVIHAGRGATAIGAWDVHSADIFADIAPLLRMLLQAGFVVDHDPDVKQRMWRKLIINSVINPLSALSEKENGRLPESPHIRELMYVLWEEGRAVAAAEGFLLEQGMWEEILQICRNTYHNRSSMLQDVMNGRKTEIDAINGFLTEKGKKHGLQMTANQLMVTLVRAKEERRAGKGE